MESICSIFNVVTEMTEKKGEQIAQLLIINWIVKGEEKKKLMEMDEKEEGNGRPNDLYRSPLGYGKVLSCEMC